MAKQEKKQAENKPEAKKIMQDSKATEAPSTKEPEKIIPTEVKKAEPKKEEKKITKKDEAIAKGNDMHASKKQCMYICRFIKGKSVDKAIEDLQEVIKMKRVIPFKGEIPHRSQEGVMSGRYPITACKLFIPLLKCLKGNIIANQMELDKSSIVFASATWASRPSKRGGGRFKRTNVFLKAAETTKEVSNKATSKSS